MPLSGAEKTRRWREKLKKERPDEYANQLRKNLERTKSKKKKISEMTPEEAEIQREKWRKEKHSQKKIKNNKQSSDSHQPNKEANTHHPLLEKNVKYLQKYNKILKQKCKIFSNLSQNLKKQRDAYKKKYFRLEKKMKNKIQDLETNIMKMQARHEVLESTLKKTYQNAHTHKEKLTLKKLVENSQNKKFLSKMLGLKGKARTSNKKKVKRVEIKQITNFYLQDDVSRNTAGKKETRTKNKQKVQIRYMVDTFVNLFKKYRADGGRYGFTTFYKNKPFYVLSPHLNARDTCLCIKHSNITYKHCALRFHGELTTGIDKILDDIVCNSKDYICMNNKCPECRDKQVQFRCLTDDEKVASWSIWERINHTYTKKEGNINKEIKTKKTVKSRKTGSLGDLKMEYQKDLIEFKKHHFNMRHQQNQYQQLVSQLKDNEALVVCDFSENYDAKLAEEIQAMHFGASKNQITLHTGMIYWRQQCQSFCTVSETNNHQPPAIWAHLTPIINLIKETTPNVDVIHFFSDGPSSQYRQKNNFYLLARLRKEFGLKYATWSFFESGHGKSVADGIGGTIKRVLDRKVCQGADVADAQDAYNILKQCLKTIKVFLIADSCINKMTKLLPKNIQALKGTQQVHQVITQSDNAIKFRDVSCFCEPLRGNCNCFSPKTHFVTSDDRRCHNSSSATIVRSVRLKKSTSPETLKYPTDMTTEASDSIDDSHSFQNENITNSNDMNHETVNGSSDTTQTNKKPIAATEDMINIKLKPMKHKTVTVTAVVQGCDTDVDQLSETYNDCERDSVRKLSPANKNTQPISSLKTTSSTSNEAEVSLKFLDSENLSDDSLNISNVSNEVISINQVCEHINVNEMPIIFASDIKEQKKYLKVLNPNVDMRKRKSSTIKKESKNKKVKTVKQSSILECNNCKCSILGRKGKCMVCKKWYCDECTNGPVEFDYICDFCFTAE